MKLINLHSFLHTIELNINVKNHFFIEFTFINPSVKITAQVTITRRFFMGWLKRVSLFILLNFLIILTLSFVMRIFNIQPFLTRQGLDPKALLIFCSIWGMGGAFISLLLSKKMAKWMMGVEILSPSSNEPVARQLCSIIEKQAKQLGIPVPEVGVFHSEIPNAFATGPSKSHSLVALSSGLLNQMNEKELEAVIGHEMSHIANGDMVTMTLLQGVVNAFVMFLARILAYFFASGRSRNGSTSFGAYYLLTFLFEIVFMILGSIVVCGFSRRREFRADFGGAQLAGKENMIHALLKLSELAEVSKKRLKTTKQPEAIAALMIHSVKHKKWLELFSTHPSIEKRIAYLKRSI